MDNPEIIKIAEEIDNIIGKHFWGSTYPAHVSEGSGAEVDVALGIKNLLIKFAEEMWKSPR